jgi:AraC-like DNA-binding protein
MDDCYLAWAADKNEFIDISVYSGDKPVKTHMHDFMELVFVAQGTCLHQYRSNEMMLIPGDVLVIFPHESHSYSINSQTVIYNCLYYPQAIGSDFELLKEINGVNSLFLARSAHRAELQKQDILHLNPADSAYIESVLRRMIEEQNNRNIGHGVVQKSNLVLLIATLGRLWDNQFKGSSYYFNDKRNMLADTLRFIDTNYANELNVKQLAQRAYMSPANFSRIFKETTGLSALVYINKVRISKSIKLLEDCSLSIGRVAEMVGIADVNYFTRLFHAKLGYTPSQYRRKTGIC